MREFFELEIFFLNKTIVHLKSWINKLDIGVEDFQNAIHELEQTNNGLQPDGDALRKEKALPSDQPRRTGPFPNEY